MADFITAFLLLVLLAPYYTARPTPLYKSERCSAASSPSPAVLVDVQKPPEEAAQEAAQAGMDLQIDIFDGAPPLPQSLRQRPLKRRRRWAALGPHPELQPDVVVVAIVSNPAKLRWADELYRPYREGSFKDAIEGARSRLGIDTLKDAQEAAQGWPADKIILHGMAVMHTGLLPGDHLRTSSQVLT